MRLMQHVFMLSLIHISLIGLFRELLGAGQIFGAQVLSLSWFTDVYKRQPSEGCHCSLEAAAF